MFTPTAEFLFQVMYVADTDVTDLVDPQLLESLLPNAADTP